MSAKKTAPSAEPPAPKKPAPLPFAGALQKHRHARLLFVLGVVLTLGIGMRAAWKRWGEPATERDDYRLTPAQIVITPQPDYIRTDVKADVVRDAHLTEMSLHDRQLLDKLTRAFALHSWVGKVRRVQKSYPAKVEIELEYRCPVAMVEIASATKPGLLFIDADSVLLPSDDFAANQTREFLRIAAGDALPTGVYGTPWGSKAIAGAAKIAEAWGERWKSVGIYRIVVLEDLNARTFYELHSRNEGRAIWGSAPGEELTGEPTVVEKIDRLTAIIAKQGSFDKSTSAGVIDLRGAAVTAPTASKHRNNAKPAAETAKAAKGDDKIR